MKYFILYIFFWGLSVSGIKAQQQITFSPNCIKAYDALLYLKIPLAKQWIAAEKSENPPNIVPYFLENYIDFFELFLNEDPAAYEKLKGNKKKRIAIIEKGPSNSPLKIWMQSVIQLQWAVVDYKFGSRISAGWGFRDALLLIKQNQKKFPDFTPNLMISGPVQMAASTVPKSYKWFSSIIGVSGNLEQGKQQLSKFLAANDVWAKIFRNEGIFYHCYLQFYLLNEPESALEYVKNNNLDVVNKHLFTFMAANLYLNNKQSHLAKQIVKNRNMSSEYMATTVWDFELSYASLYHLEPDTEFYFKRFLKNFKGNYYVKDAWLKLSYWHLLQGNKTEYERCRNMVVSAGKQDSEADKRAYKEVQSGITPNLQLLKARLLSDGGYHREALQILAGKSTNDFNKSIEKLEFTYRLGRIYDDMGQDEKALQAYGAAYTLGRTSTEYFAARAALQMGMIYENKNQLSAANNEYNRCIALEGHDYENSLEQKAKAGLERCKQKKK